MEQINHLSNQELARQVERWADVADLAEQKQCVLSPEQLRIIAERLRMPTDEDLELAVEAEREAVLARVKARVDTTQLNAIISDLESPEG